MTGFIYGHWQRTCNILIASINSKLDGPELNVDLKDILGHRIIGLNSEFDGHSILEISEALASKVKVL